MRTASVMLRAICLVGSIVASGSSQAEHLVQSSTEMRTYIYLQISNDKLKKFLPEGWASNPGTKLLQGANVGIVFIEGLAAADADNKPVPFHDSYAVIGVLAKNVQSGISTFMVVKGLVPSSQPTPGAYGAYFPAKVTMTKGVKTDDAGSSRKEDWSFATDSGDRLSFSTEFQLDTGTKAHIEPRVYSGIKPDFYRIYKVDQTTDIVHSVAAEGRKAKSVSFSASGPRLGEMFDGSEEVVAVMSVPAYQRAIYLPD